jgi:type I restriction enzyme, S subunit
VLAAAFRGDLTADWRAAHSDIEPASEFLLRVRAERRCRWEQTELAKYKAQNKEPQRNWQDKYEEPELVNSTELPKLPQGWGYTRIDTLLSQTRQGIKTGPFGSLLKKHEHSQQGVPVLGIENISRMRFVEGSKIYITAEKAEFLSDYDVFPNDILISRSGTVGEVCVVPESVRTARFSTNIIRVVLADGVMRSTFFGYMITGSPFVKRQISEACAGSTRDFLNKAILESLVFPLPPIAEQDVIVERLERLFNWTSTISDIVTGCIEDLDSLDQAILAKAFGGELVSQDPSDEPASVLVERIRAQRNQQTESAKQTSKAPQRNKMGKKWSRLQPQQLTLAELLRTAD